MKCKLKILQILLLIFFLLGCLIVILSRDLSSASRQPVRAKHGMVVSADSLASRVGVEILQKGGNAVDAAVAVGFALAVTYPGAGNLGGGGYMVIRMANGETATIDYREKAPTAAYRDMFLDAQGNFFPEKSQKGHLAAGVPGSVAGLLLALKKFGTMELSEVIQPAIDFAENGFVVNSSLAENLEKLLPEFKEFPSSLKVFSHNGQPFHEGERFVQKDLAKTLRLIKDNGGDGFYEGENAELIVSEMKRGSGLIALNDLKEYQPIIRKPVVGSYRGYEIISMGPSSSGGIGLLQLLNIVEGYNLASTGFLSSKTIHLMVEAMKRIYADRAEFLGDPDFYDVPNQWLISKTYAAQRRKEIDTLKATPSAHIHHGEQIAHEGRETTHYSIVDQSGNAVSTTTTLNDAFGSKVVVEGTGFLLNNEMDDCSAKPGVPNMYGLIGSEGNSVKPKKRMLSSMTPTIVVKDNKPVLIVGSPGGGTIITTVFQIVVNVIDFQMNIEEAIDAPRVHHQWFPDTLYVEKRGLPQDIIDNLTTKGHHVVEREGYQGMAQGIFIDHKKGLLFGATDPRGSGAALGY